MTYFKRFLKYAIPYKWIGITSIFLNILYALFSALSFLTLIPMLNVLFGDTKKIYQEPILGEFSTVSKEYLENYLNYLITINTQNQGPESTLAYMVFSIVIVFFLKNLFGYLGGLFMVFLKNSVLKDLRNEIYEKIISLPISYFSQKRKGDTIARSTGDIGTINETFLNLSIVIIREPLNIIFTLIFMVNLSPELSLFVFTFIPLSGWIISLISKKIKSQSATLFKQGGIMLSIIEETITGLKVIKAFNSESFFTKKYDKFNTDIKTLSNQLSKRNAMASPLSEFLGIVTIASLLWFGGRMVLIDASLNASTFIAFMGLAYNILTPAKAISKASNAVKIGNSAAERVFEVLDTINPLQDKEKPHQLSTFKKEVKFENISFKYNTEYVLKDFSLIVPKGKKIALVGHSGSGKSTLANLITRFWDVTKGQITIDGINIKDVTTSSLRKQMGIVTQDSILFNDTIANNISLGIENPSHEKIVEAAKIANAHDFIMEFPEQYNSPVGDGGGMLSGGQKQRISIARAVMKNPPIMILDEATSALDTESEQLVQEAIENMMQNRTSLVIAHRLSTIQNADLIVVMKKGLIVEQGTHEQLMTLKGAYNNLVTLQKLES
ncbi:ABC transporter ATP-binding protein [Flavicella sp.]|uniref:ABC transporter ATP-binding protein n=1 Tax=Flavicella sp. TaxID=2957742 RepID=UPI00301A34C9